MTRPRGGAAALLLLLAAPAGLAATLELPASASVAEQEAEALGSHQLATGPWSDGTLPTLATEGAITREVVRIESPGLTTLQILAPLRDQIAEQGYEILLDCETEVCGGFDFRAAIEVLPPPAMFVDLADFRYLSARKGDRALSLLVSRSAATGFVQIVRVTPPGEIAPQPVVVPAPPPPGPLPPPPALRSLADRLQADGRVTLDGLAFATGSADLAPGGDASLASLAAWLVADPSRRVAIVGHTDALGPLEPNIALSRRRAQAVAARLAEDHDVPRAQLEAHGMGWLSPVATNLTPEGREANRRVEAVLLP